MATARKLNAMHQVPELFVPASERPPQRDWRTVLARLYWSLGVLAIIVALYAGLATMPLGHLREGLMPAVVVTLSWYGFGHLMAWIFGPALSHRGQ